MDVCINLQLTRQNLMKNTINRKERYNAVSYTHLTGIGRNGHQDSIDNNMYRLNIEVLSHKMNKRHLLVFEKRKSAYYFAGEYRLMETHQNVQPDSTGILRRVFVFHLEQIAPSYKW